MSPREVRLLGRVGSLLLLLVGCTGGDKDSGRPAGDSAPPVDPLCEQDACLCEDPQVSVGTGDDSFVPLEEGDPVMMVHGPQGGWHMLGSVQVAHTTEVVNIRFVIDTLDGVVVADNNLNVLLISEEVPAACRMYAYLSVEDLAQGDLDTLTSCSPTRPSG